MERGRRPAVAAQKSAHLSEIVLYGDERRSVKISGSRSVMLIFRH